MVFPPPPDESKTIEMLARIREGDQASWEDLYHRYHDELLFTIRAKLGSRLRAVLESEDVLQSVALEAFRALPNFVPHGEGSLRAWLHRIVLNKIRDRADTWRAGKRDLDRLTPVESLDALPGDGSEPAYFGEPYVRLERALQRLPEDLRELIVLRKCEGYSSKEVAERMGKSDDMVRKLYSKAMARLVTEMGAQEPRQ